MRSRSSLSLFVTDPSHRARPNCALSLATVSASTSHGAGSSSDLDAMDVDMGSPPDPLVLPTWRIIDGVPFPSSTPERSSRKHALLRSSSSPVEDNTMVSQDATQDSSEPPSPTEQQQPPRKRTRTAALLLPPLKPHRSSRLQSVPVRIPPSRFLKSAPSLLVSGRTHDSAPPKSDEPFTYAFPTLSSPTVVVVSHSPLLSLISSLITPPHAPLNSLANSNIRPARRRKRFPGGTYMLSNVYRSLLFGLASKYSVPDSSQDCRVSSDSTVKSPLDVQDALLADRLRWHLTLQGEDPSMVALEVLKIDQRTISRDMISPSAAENSGCSPPPEGTSSSGIKSYQQLVSFLLLQRKTEGKNKTKKVTESPWSRSQSKLAESFSIDTA